MLDKITNTGMRRRSTGWKFRALYTVLAVLFSMFCGVAAEADDIELTVNVKEHRSAPDLSNVPRIRFLTTADFPPFSFVDAGGKLAGFNVDLVREICDHLKIDEKCQIQVLPFGELEDALNARAGEAVIAGVAVTDERRRRFAFSRSYLALPARFSANGSDDGDLVGPESFNGREVGVVAGSAQEIMLRAFFPRVKAKPFETLTLTLDALKKKEVPAVFGSGLQLAFWQMSEEAEGCCHFIGGPFYSRYFLGEGMTIMTRKSEPLARAFDAALIALAADGTLNELFQRYFPGGL